MRRLLPDFFKPQRDHPAGSAAAEPQRGAAQPARADIIDAKRAAAQRLLDTCPTMAGGSS
jgi:hypothetical protein